MNISILKYRYSRLRYSGDLAKSISRRTHGFWWAKSQTNNKMCPSLTNNTPYQRSRYHKSLCEGKIRKSTTYY